MRHLFITLTAATSLLVVVWSAKAQPGADGAVLRNPFEAATPPGPAKPPQDDEDKTAVARRARRQADLDKFLARLAVDPSYLMNKDIAPTPELGPWMIFVHSYITKEAPQWAREMAAELRTTYKLPAYVFTYGIEERREELERVKAIIDQQRDFLLDKDLPLMYAPRRAREGQPDTIVSEDLPAEYISSLLRVRHIKVQCGVLVGGYPNEAAAKRALDGIRGLPLPDPNKVKLDLGFQGQDDDKNLKATEGGYINPFRRAFMCRNPSVKVDPAQKQNDALDIKLLRKLNADDPLTLLNCKKPYTLAIKEFRTFTMIQDRDREKSVLENFGFKTRSNSEGVDQAAHDAHNLAEALRKQKLEAYALHTKFSSVVTVGAFDGLDDPRLAATQQALERELARMEERLPPGRRIMFFPKPLPMQVPR
jgi:hypothetical protein